MATGNFAMPSPVSTWRNAPYDAINPSQPALSTAGKTILVTGGGRGLGARIAYAYAQSGAAVIGLTGRTEKSLEESKKAIEADFPDTKVITSAADVSDAAAVDVAFKKTAEVKGGVDILVHNAAIFPWGEDLKNLEGEKLKEWWSAFEVNVLGSTIVTQAFLKYKSSNDPKFVYVGTAAVTLPAGSNNFSSYIASKQAASYTLQHFAQGHRGEYKYFPYHPGVVTSTGMGEDAVKQGSQLPEDHIDLGAHFAVWLASPEAEFLRDRFSWTNWDVTELKEKAEVIKADPDWSTIGLAGFPYQKL